MEAERRSLSEALRASDRQALEDHIDKRVDAVAAQFAQLFTRMDDHLTELGEKLDRLYEIVGIPRDTEVPTLAEQLNAAASDAAVRKQIQLLVAEAEFENTEVEFH